MRSLTFLTPDQRSQNRKSHEKVFWLLCWYQVWQSTSAKDTVSSRTVKFVKYVEHTASHENHGNTGCWIIKLCSLLVSVWSLQRSLAERTLASLFYSYILSCSKYFAKGLLELPCLLLPSDLEWRHYIGLKSCERVGLGSVVVMPNAMMAGMNVQWAIGCTHKSYVRKVGC